MLTPPSLLPLIPQEHPLPNGNTLHLFRNDAVGILKLDFTLEAGSAYQSFKSQSHAANQLFAETTVDQSPEQVAEFLDFRGIVVERSADVCTGNVSFYFMRKFADELLPLIARMFEAPSVTPQLFDAYISRRIAQLKTNFQRTNYLARNRYYELLYGYDHSMGTYASPQDLQKLTLPAVTDFMRQHYNLATAHIILSGPVDDELIRLVECHLAPQTTTAAPARVSLPVTPRPPAQPDHIILPGTVQSTIRIGRILPFPWHSMDYTRFMVLNTVLGGYFGSRLMSNLREDKGYTYGIYSQTQIFRDSIVLYITADVAAPATHDAVNEILHEIEHLRKQPVPEDELERVRNYMMGDFIRSIDGIFEISERYRQMVSTDVDERLSANLMETLATVTPAQLLPLAQTTLTDLITVTAGPALDPQ